MQLLSGNKMKICIVFGHYNTKDSFNASVRDTFIDEAKKIGPLESSFIKKKIIIINGIKKNKIKILRVISIDLFKI